MSLDTLYGAGARPAVEGDRFNRVTINNNFYSRDIHGWNDNWRGGGYWNSRPWNHGWYGGWGGWSWWGASAAAWGVAGLATGAAIGSLVNAAADQQSTLIVVPETDIQLDYGSVESVGTGGVSFNYNLEGSGQLSCSMPSARWPTALAAESPRRWAHTVAAGSRRPHRPRHGVTDSRVRFCPSPGSPAAAWAAAPVGSPAPAWGNHP
ncbi:hypothetical protein [Cyanobium sp. NS01]|uniref:hypothetical protein n=1 Tax=Cyanobium sp. NS01 TaxID=261284 RepID=UPI00185FB1DA|nr:hypothetical protein [Cyanobium sp. NS01]QNI70706.1 hypothetical protein CyaNS01_01574 [Cyanobium sp. NS01]